MGSRLSGGGGGGGGSYSLPTASSSVLSGVKVGSGLAIDGSGVLSTTGSAVQKIAEVIVGAGGQSTISFSNIPQTYSHLLLETNGRGDAVATSSQLFMQVNGDTGTNYDSQEIYAAGATVSGGASAALAHGAIGYMSAASSVANQASSSHVTISNYKSTQWFKTYDYTGGIWLSSASGANYTVTGSGQWRSTAAITSILLFLASGSFLQGSVATLYGQP